MEKFYFRQKHTLLGTAFTPSSTHSVPLKNKQYLVLTKAYFLSYFLPFFFNLQQTFYTFFAETYNSKELNGAAVMAPVQNPTWFW